MCSAKPRASTSTAPPGARPAIMVIGRDGGTSAGAPVGTAHATNATARSLCIVPPRRGGGARKPWIVRFSAARRGGGHVGEVMKLINALPASACLLVGVIARRIDRKILNLHRGNPPTGHRGRPCHWSPLFRRPAVSRPWRRFPAPLGCWAIIWSWLSTPPVRTRKMTKAICR